jgi:ATP-dependent helicase/DNAse subunit B
VRARLTRSEEGERLSPSYLNEFEACAYSWFLRRGLGIKEKQTEIETIDQRELGTLYHRILQRLFERIKVEDARFRSDRLPRYKELLVQEADAALEEARASEGAFQESVYAMLRSRLINALSAYLDADAERLHSCAVLGAEFPLKRAYSELGLSLSGIADLVLRTDEETLAIVDFKTGLMPAAAALVPDEAGFMGDLQMASYIRMLEGDGASKVRSARFYSIDNRRFRHVVADEERSRANSLLPLRREEYDDALKAVDETMETVAGALEESAYPVPQPGYRAACATCKVLAVCRLPYAGGEP